MAFCCLTSDAFLADKKRFHEHAEELLGFLAGHAGEVPAVVECLVDDVMRPRVELLYLLAVDVALVGTAEDVDESRAPDGAAPGSSVTPNWRAARAAASSPLFEPCVRAQSLPRPRGLPRAEWRRPGLPRSIATRVTTCPHSILPRMHFLRAAHPLPDTGGQFTAALVAKNARVDVANQFGLTPLAEAVRQGDPRMVSTLLGAGSGTEGANLDGQTALMIAIKNGALPIVEMLLAAGAQVNVVEQVQQQTPLMWAAAATRHAAEIIACLERAGFKVVRLDA